ncbi:hypothetical protein, unlikely [Trypanosoma brucei brucei TREU927]|uniref:Uncharacterized protein n=1 Tax=Trypanosoma brucei brucei (strain 927/4 GUTat10.1) TaxID=185431 RepID=Q4GYH0_TRYB2|nr:hypothetical protein, unlikely [Trypanosoma brucei brucei TREU927]CAJ16614.1 hypothetical protein, unlikely [Trypanosoma brucei brucei TREU927]
MHILFPPFPFFVPSMNIFCLVGVVFPRSLLFYHYFLREKQSVCVCVCVAYKQWREKKRGSEVFKKYLGSRLM